MVIGLEDAAIHLNGGFGENAPIVIHSPRLKQDVRSLRVEWVSKDHVSSLQDAPTRTNLHPILEGLVVGKSQDLHAKERRQMQRTIAMAGLRNGLWHAGQETELRWSSSCSSLAQCHVHDFSQARQCSMLLS